MAARPVEDQGGKRRGRRREGGSEAGPCAADTHGLEEGGAAASPCSSPCRVNGAAFMAETPFLRRGPARGWETLPLRAAELAHRWFLGFGWGAFVLLPCRLKPVSQRPRGKRPLGPATAAAGGWGVAQGTGVLCGTTRRCKVPNGSNRSACPELRVG